jgi:hypothetical protein
MTRLCEKGWRGARVVLLGALSIGLWSGCGDGAGTEATDAGLLYSCATETRAVHYMANLTLASTSGAFTAVLVESVPGPPAKGTNAWTVKILDASGAPQDGLTITGVPNMPDHRHPATVRPVVTPIEGSAGTYSVTPVYLFMPGYWEVTLTLQVTGGAKDTVVFPVCIPG